LYCQEFLPKKKMPNNLKFRSGEARKNPRFEADVQIGASIKLFVSRRGDGFSAQFTANNGRGWSCP